jgi:hypothetical protein
MTKVFGWLESAGEKVLHVALGNDKDKMPRFYTVAFSLIVGLKVKDWTL